MNNLFVKKVCCLSSAFCRVSFRVFRKDYSFLAEDFQTWIFGSFGSSQKNIQKNHHYKRIPLCCAKSPDFEFQCSSEHSKTPSFHHISVNFVIEYIQFPPRFRANEFRQLCLLKRLSKIKNLCDWRILNNIYDVA